MSGFKRIPLEIKEQVLTRAKEGIPVAQLSNEHGISEYTYTIQIFQQKNNSY